MRYKNRMAQGCEKIGNFLVGECENATRFSRGFFYKRLMALALPIALQNLISFSANLSGNLMVGTLGGSALSGMYAAGQMQLLLQVFTMGIEGAMLLISSQYRGSGDLYSVRSIISLGLKASLLAGSVFALFSFLFPANLVSLFTKDASVISSGAGYLFTLAISFPLFALSQAMTGALRIAEKAKIGFFISLVSLALTLIVSYCFIFGRFGAPALAERGAALGIIAGRGAELLMLSVYLLKIEKSLNFRLSDLLHTDKALLSDLVKYGTPILFGQLVWAVNAMAATAIIGRGRSAEALTAASVAGVINGIAYVLPSGITGALNILIGNAVGEDKSDFVKSCARSLLPLLAALGVVTFMLVHLIKAPVIALYNISEAESSIADAFINVLSVTLIGTCIQLPCLLGLVKGGGEGSFPLKLDLIFVPFIIIPSALITTSLGYPAWVVFACLKCDQILKCLIAVAKVYRFDWVRRLTRKR